MLVTPRFVLYTCSVLLGGFLVAPVAATTVIAPTFAELVRDAEIVFEGEVIDTKARVSVEREGETIITDVYFRVAKVLKGTVGPTTLLEFLGGTIGDRTYRIEGMPTFTIGDRDVIFAAPSRRLISPLVGIMHGRVRIVKDGAMRQDLVRRFDGALLRNLSMLGSSQPQLIMSPQPAMSLSSFESAVIAEIARQKPRTP
jgi:hypothetical protein